MTWDYSETYVAACYRTFSSYAEGLRHEQACDECQRFLRGEDEDYEDS